LRQHFKFCVKFFWEKRRQWGGFGVRIACSSLAFAVQSPRLHNSLKFPTMSRLGENSFDGNLLEKLLNDRVLGRYVATVGYSSLSSVQECRKPDIGSGVSLTFPARLGADEP
jgi:hypothetical protein